MSWSAIGGLVVLAIFVLGTLIRWWLEARGFPRELTREARRLRAARSGKPAKDGD